MYTCIVVQCNFQWYFSCIVTWQFQWLTAGHPYVPNLYRHEYRDAGRPSTSLPSEVHLLMAHQHWHFNSQPSVHKSYLIYQSHHADMGYNSSMVNLRSLWTTIPKLEGKTNILSINLMYLIKIPFLPTWISEIGYLPLPSRDMAEIPLKWRKSLKQPTNQPHKRLMIV